jgi:uncharacterized membrane protein YgdD (TMEM256/DUF423 family)
MKRLGIALIIVGAGLMVFALFMTVGVSAPDYVTTDPALQSGMVANVDMIGQREVIATVGGSAFISGWLALIASYLRTQRPPE